MSTKGKLIVLAAFQKNDDGELVPAFDPRQVDTEDRAKRDARLMADQYVGVVAWSREADPAIGEYGPPGHHLPERGSSGFGVSAQRCGTKSLALHSSPQKSEVQMSKATYTLTEFTKAYSLEATEAERIFRLSGPSKANLEVFMKVYKKPKAAEQFLFGVA